MEIFESQFFFSTNVDGHKLQHSNANLLILTQPRIEKSTQQKKKDEQVVDDVISSHVHDKILQAFKDNDTLSYHVRISNTMAKWKVIVSTNINKLSVAFLRHVLSYGCNARHLSRFED